MSDTVRLLLADDNDQFRSGLRALFTAVAETEVVAEAVDGDEAVALAERLQPDVVLMDIRMPVTNGIEATRRILASSPHIGVLVLTMVEDDESVFAAMRAGARGYLLKGALRAEILRAIRAVYNGEAVFGPAIARRLMQYFAGVRHDPIAQAFPQLSEREREILELLAEHRTNAEIAHRLELTTKTVRNHVSNILTKLQVTTRAEVIVRARSAYQPTDEPTEEVDVADPLRYATRPSRARRPHGGTTSPWCFASLGLPSRYGASSVASQIPTARQEKRTTLNGRTVS